MSFVETVRIMSEHLAEGVLINASEFKEAVHKLWAPPAPAAPPAASDGKGAKGDGKGA